ncbi:sialic acid TRAP transporter substrate-binding protein SiaP [Ammoniphilus resinae]|uniref:Tripartite ATP-independent transporter DctP family solute receptor n=1 Tax=Ammoniphilus resinae TaxID=861532 RepID=A0ABS4GSS2_9BACL|nr:sialic acid TRAP transporter substrate-binding protein SiaP [Ammoniphilus resinae]MBP1933330.1 tripartite ATP-independent transporter DctP family solute receptor [Ammoniphilus resinae]
MMKKCARQWICLLACFALLVGCSGGVETNSGGEKPSTTKVKDAPVVLKLAHGYAPEHPFAIGAENIAKEINEKSGGRLDVKVYPGGQLGSEKDLVDGLTTGSVDMTMAGPGELGKRFKPMLIFDGPFVFRDAEHLMKAMNGEFGQELANEMAKEIGIRSLSVLYMGQRYITTSNVPINTPEDLKGVKLRVPDQPLSVANAKAMGATPTPMAFSEVYLGLQQGVIDGQENPLAQITSAKFNEVQKYISLTGHVTQAVAFIINDQKLNSLSSDLQKIVTDVVHSNGEKMNQAILDFEKSALDDLKAKGMEVIEPDVDAFREATKSVITEFESEWGAGIYEKIQAVK